MVRIRIECRLLKEGEKKEGKRRFISKQYIFLYSLFILVMVFFDPHVNTPKKRFVYSGSTFEMFDRRPPKEYVWLPAANPGTQWPGHPGPELSSGGGNESD